MSDVLNFAPLRAFVDCVDELAVVNAAKKTLEEKKRKLEQLAEGALVEANLTSAPVVASDGSTRTVAMSPMLTAKLREGIDRDDVSNILVEIGAGDLVKYQYNSRTLDSWIRESFERDGEIPSALSAAVDIVTIPRMSVRRVAARTTSSTAAAVDKMNARNKE